MLLTVGVCEVSSPLQAAWIINRASEQGRVPGWVFCYPSLIQHEHTALDNPIYPLSLMCVCVCVCVQLATLDDSTIWYLQNLLLPGNNSRQKAYTSPVKLRLAASTAVINISLVESQKHWLYVLVCSILLYSGTDNMQRPIIY